MGLVRRKLKYIAIGFAAAASVVCGAYVAFRSAPYDISRNISAVIAVASDTYEITEPHRLSTAPNVTVERGTVSIVRPDSGSVSTTAAIARLLLGGSASLKVAKPRIVIDLGHDAMALETMPPSGLSLAPFLSAIAGSRFKSLDLVEATVVVRRDGQADMIIDKVTGKVMRSAKNVSMTGSFALRGRPVQFDAAAGAPRTDALNDAPNAAVLPLRATLTGEFLSANIRGEVTTGDIVKLTAPKADIAVSDMRRAAEWLGIGWPDMKAFQNLRVTGQLTWLDKVISIENGAFASDAGEARGAMSINLADARPAVDATLAVSSLDMDTLAPSSDRGPPGKPDVSITSSIFSTLESMRAIMKTLDGDLRISAEKVIASQASWRSAAASVSIRKDKILADLAELDIDGTAKVSGQFKIEPKGDALRYAMHGNFEEMELGRIERVLLGTERFDARADVAFDLESLKGGTKDVLKSLSGTIAIASPAGGSFHGDIDALALAVTPVDPQRLGDGSTSFETLNANIRVDSGAATVVDALAVTSDYKVMTKGTFDVGGHTINLNVAISSTDGTSSTPGTAAHAKSFLLTGGTSSLRITPANQTALEPSANDRLLSVH